MNKEQCRYKETCEAQLCPLDENLDDYVFYADEAICKNPEYSGLRWINRQRALRKNKKTEDIGFFTKKMLEVLGRVTRKTKGIDTRLENQGKATAEWIQRCLRKKSSRMQTAIISANGAHHDKSPRPPFPAIFFIGVN